MHTGLDSLRTASKKVVRKTGEILGNLIDSAVAKSYNNKSMEMKWKSKKYWGNNYSTKKKGKNINKLKQIL